MRNGPPRIGLEKIQHDVDSIAGGNVKRLLLILLVGRDQAVILVALEAITVIGNGIFSLFRISS